MKIDEAVLSGVGTLESVSEMLPSNTHFDFRSKVFQAPGVRFVLSWAGAAKAKRAVFAIALGKGEGMIDL